ncbi:MAG TPA: DUF2318 domain-containing protein [Bacillota bacterium]|nr:DUF2318 domain-containing protein [Bacillota bacterium]HOK69351.1 DUF2318 domain-containing protein [Bacillota bacterium]HPP85213.1 DUF2318 domain-containing protein [Bacillota bacterium]
MSQSKKRKNTAQLYAKKAEPKSNLWKITALSLLVVAIAVIAVLLITSQSGGSADGKSDSAGNGDLVIPTGEITEKAKFYPVKVDGTKLEVIAVRASDGTIRTAFNTCQVCYSSGRGYYKQEGSFLVCQNCGNRFGTDDVEVTRGGCNPVPITAADKIVTDTDITIPKEFLAKAKAIFANWKR